VAFETNCRSAPVPFALLLKRTPTSLVPDALARGAASRSADALVAPIFVIFIPKTLLCSASIPSTCSGPFTPERFASRAGLSLEFSRPGCGLKFGHLPRSERPDQGWDARGRGMLSDGDVFSEMLFDVCENALGCKWNSMRTETLLCITDSGSTSHAVGFRPND
jgi:hypothetical protein